MEGVVIPLGQIERIAEFNAELTHFVERKQMTQAENEHRI